MKNECCLCVNLNSGVTYIFLYDFLFFGAFVANAVLYGLYIGSDEKLAELYKDRLKIMTDTFSYTPTEAPPSNLMDLLRYSVYLMTIVPGTIVLVIYIPRIIGFMYMKCFPYDQEMRRKAYIVRVSTSVLLLVLLIGLETIVIVFLVQSNFWLFGVNILPIIAYGGGILLTIAFDLYFSCVYGNYHIFGFGTQKMQSFDNNWSTMNTQREMMKRRPTEANSQSRMPTNESYSPQKYQFSPQATQKPDSQNRAFGFQNQSQQGPNIQKSRSQLVQKLSLGIKSRGIMEGVRLN
ncbi:UNKNOWN [Stylonychia lemnae]|uniref:Transmembrane protein n=1 Tax=Stylonychia lemnae TaxID=5949 RepID=A0A078B5T0_STYLE|nr:UNKNOWN [Stylonychia lemnae]|eukprot:CDW89779.1 UNKNOWN [Stylonychia lemnae]